MYQVISEELIKQEVKKGLVSGKSFNTVADHVVGKWCIMIKAKSGKLCIGIDVDKKEALNKAILKIN